MNLFPTITLATSRKPRIAALGICHCRCSHAALLCWFHPHPIRLGLDAQSRDREVGLATLATINAVIFAFAIALLRFLHVNPKIHHWMFSTATPHACGWRACAYAAKFAYLLGLLALLRRGIQATQEHCSRHGGLLVTAH